jgi:hypothetical protein
MPSKKHNMNNMHGEGIIDTLKSAYNYVKPKIDFV